MSTKTKRFVVFGRVYRTRQFAALPGIQLMDKEGDIHPVEILRQTDVHDGIDWKPLDNENAINELVFDASGALNPILCLRGLMEVVSEFNFGFLSGWKGVKIPSRFLDGSSNVATKHVDPLLSNIIGDGVASMRELEEYYSLEDAYKMFDLMAARSVNQALANEAATKASRQR